MTLNLEIRKLIRSHLESGKKTPEIFKQLNKTIPKRTIYRWVKRLSNGDMKANVSPGRPRKFRNKTFIAKIKRNLTMNVKRKSAREIAKDNNCSRRTIARIIAEDLNLKPYKKIPSPDLNEAHISKRYTFCCWVRKNYNHERCQSILFSDEKMFDANGQINRQNDRIYAASRDDANSDMGLHPMKKFPFKVMVWLGVTWNGFTSLVVLPPKTSFNSDFYSKEVLPIVKRDGTRLIGPKFIFQQDGASCHTSEETIQALKNLGIAYIGPDRWPPNSPDLNPLDYFVWNEIENHLKSKKFNNRDDLIKKIKESIKEIPKKMIRDAIKNFRSRIYEVEKSRGNIYLK